MYLVAVLAPAGAAVLAQTGSSPLCPAVPPGTTCPAPAIGEELRAVPELKAAGGALDVTFRLETRTFCVPVLASATAPWSAQAMTLRTYVYTDPATRQEGCGYPGPTLRLRKAESERPGAPADALSVLLVNNLTPQDATACDDPCPAATVCPSDSKDLPKPSECPQQPLPMPAGSAYSTCCCWTRLTQSYPSCMHGDNTTNLHFHGAPRLAPAAAGLRAARAAAQAGRRRGPADHHATHARGTVVFGQFQYDVDPPPRTQPRAPTGTTRTSTARSSLQVANGMPGALLIEGPFDDWLSGYYKRGRLAEKTLVLQQIQSAGGQPVPARGRRRHADAVNGQVSPTVTMLPGEVQRWRFVNATHAAGAPGHALLPRRRDGAPDRHGRRPLRAARTTSRQPLFDPANPTAFNLAPGNRADFLVEAPAQPGTYHVRFQTRALSPRAQERFRRMDEALAPGVELPPLVQLVVAAPAEGAPPAKVATGFPPADKWPPMPDYLADLPAGSDKLSLVFDLTVDGGGTPVGGDPTTRFFINGKRFDPSCVDVQTKLGGVADWTVTNGGEGGVPHTLHIHINPFQVLTNGTTTYQAPYPWQDTILLPAPAAGTPPPAGSNVVTLRQEYLDFTGEYVLTATTSATRTRG